MRADGTPPRGHRRHGHDLISLEAVPGLPEVEPGDDLAALIAPHVRAGDVVVVSHKVVSKADGRIVDLASVAPSPAAWALGKDDPRLAQVILDEAAAVVRAERGVVICETRHGFVCANAGVDRSNVPGGDAAVLLPLDPDGSARALRAALPGHPAVIVSDTFGRAWRVGQVEVAIGVAGLEPLDDWRGRSDAHGHELAATQLATADAIAAAAELARRKDSREPVVVLRGLSERVTDADGPGAAALVRARSDDLFR